MELESAGTGRDYREHLAGPLLRVAFAAAAASVLVPIMSFGTLSHAIGLRQSKDREPPAPPASMELEEIRDFSAVLTQTSNK